MLQMFIYDMFWPRADLECELRLDGSERKTI